jgi:hypothetical protein
MTQSASVQIGPVTNDPNGARQTVSVGSWRLSVFADDKDEPKIRDVDLAERLGYQRRRNIRDLIRRLIAESKLRDVHVRRTVQRTQMPGKGGVRQTDIEEFWLTEAQALFVIAKSETPEATALLQEVIEVFRLAIRGLLTPERVSSVETRMATFLLEERHQVARFLSDKLIFEICRLYGYGHHPGNQPPQFFRKVAEMIYAAVFGDEVHAELQRRGDKRKYYELLTDNAHRLAQHDLAVLETLARQCFKPEEFWMRVNAHFRGGAIQGSLLA